MRGGRCGKGIDARRRSGMQEDEGMKRWKEKKMRTKERKGKGE